jgi:hypothetical protein
MFLMALRYDVDKLLLSDSKLQTGDSKLQIGDSLLRIVDFTLSSAGLER